jgi:hypothetical protein
MMAITTRSSMMVKPWRRTVFRSITGLSFRERIRT